VDTEPIDAVGAVLARAQHEKFIGPGPLAAHIEHAQAFRTALPGPAPTHVVDLGSGGGLPSLVLATTWPEATFLLIESNHRRASFLAESVDGLGWAARVEVTDRRAEACGQEPAWRGRADLVTARGFGPPPVTAECAAPFLRIGGHLVVSGPPDLDAATLRDRWPAAGLGLVGLEPVGAREVGEAHLAVLRQVEACDVRYPRRVGIPAKRPLF
jgi:16S rRNA (guanine527-N7)-methyltransferase